MPAKLNIKCFFLPLFKFVKVFKIVYRDMVSLAVISDYMTVISETFLPCTIGDQLFLFPRIAPTIYTG